MSCFIFGDFFSERADDLSRGKIWDDLVKGGVYIFFDEQMNDVYNEILQMLKEHPSNHSNVSFCLTSINQKYNSEDLLYPFDKYTEEELFPDGAEGNREIYMQLCLENLNPLKDAITKILDVFEPKSFRFFTTVGYDTEFDVCYCTKDEMTDDIYRQVTEEIELDSKIYVLKNLL